MDQRTKDNYSKFFLISALYNIIAAFNGMVFFEVMNKLLYGLKTKIQYGVTTFILRTFYTHVLVFGIGYYIVSRDPSQEPRDSMDGNAGQDRILLRCDSLFPEEKNHCHRISPGIWRSCIRDTFWALSEEYKK